LYKQRLEGKHNLEGSIPTEQLLCKSLKSSKNSHLKLISESLFLLNNLYKVYSLKFDKGVIKTNHKIVKHWRFIATQKILFMTNYLILN